MVNMVVFPTFTNWSATVFTKLKSACSPPTVTLALSSSPSSVPVFGLEFGSKTSDLIISALLVIKPSLITRATKVSVSTEFGATVIALLIKTKSFDIVKSATGVPATGVPAAGVTGLLINSNPIGKMSLTTTLVAESGPAFFTNKLKRIFEPMLVERRSANFCKLKFAVRGFTVTLSVSSCPSFVPELG